MDKRRQLQEEEYMFPYHYLVSTEGRFSQVRVLWWGMIYRAYIDYIIDHLPHFNSLAEVGAGDAKVISAVQRRFPDREYTAIDYSPRACALAKAMTTNIKVVQKNIVHEPVGEYDVVLCVETLEHIPLEEVVQFVQSLYQMTKHLILTVPSDNIPVSAKHYQHFNRESLTKFLKPFTTDIQYVNRETIFSNLLMSLLANRCYAITSSRVQNLAYRWYKRSYQVASDEEGRQLVAVCTHR